MKRIILLLSILFTGVAINAQSSEPTAEQRAHIQAMRLKKLCTTNDDQTQKAEAIFLSKILAIKAITEDSSKTNDVKKAEIEKVKAAKDIELSQILTSDQFATYRNKMDQMAGRKDGQQ